MNRWLCACAAVVLLYSATARGQVHEGDVIVTVLDNTVATGRSAKGELQFPWFVWTESLGSAGVPNFAADPGYDALAGTFTPGVAVGLSIRKALRVWSNESFDTIPAEWMEVNRFSNVISTPVKDPLPGETLPSLTLGLANASGLIHIHPGYFLASPHSQGVYLLELEFWVDDENIEPSEPFWIIFNQNDSQIVVAQAVQWVLDNLVGASCPADFNDDGVVNVADLLVLLSAWGDNSGHPTDLNGDGVVNVADLLALLSAWGGCA